jgi:hypothetical protein
MVYVLRLGAYHLGFSIHDLRFRVEGLGFRYLGFRV